MSLGLVELWMRLVFSTFDSHSGCEFCKMLFRFISTIEWTLRYLHQKTIQTDTFESWATTNKYKVFVWVHILKVLNGIHLYICLKKHLWHRHTIDIWTFANFALVYLLLLLSCYSPINNSSNNIALKRWCKSQVRQI